MRFVETVVGELLQQVKDLARFFLGDVMGGQSAFDELGAFLGHFFGDLLTHGTSQQVGPAQRIACHNLGNLHHLFLVDDDALGFFQDMVDRRMDRFQIAQPVLDLAIGRDVFHRAGAIQGHQRHDVFDAGGLHAPQRIHHAAAFHLKHRNRFCAGI